MRLIDAFKIRKGDLVALAGAGGKTSAMFALGREGVARGLKVVLTTTTKIYFPKDLAGLVVMAEGPELVDLVRQGLGRDKLLVAGAGLDRGGEKLAGISADLTGLFLEAGADLVLVEADGAAGRPFKAPREGEPVIPAAATLVVPVVGVDCLGRPLIDEYVHRPEVVAALSGTEIGREVSPEVVAAVLLHPRGYRKGLPPGSRWVPFINKVENGEDLHKARRLAEMLGRGGAGRVVIGTARAGQPVEVVVF